MLKDKTMLKLWIYFALLSFYVGLCQPVWAGKNPGKRTKPSTPKTSVSETSYLDCRRSAISNLRKKKTTMTESRAAIRNCQSLFPTSGVYSECKIQVVKKFGKLPKLAREKLKSCDELRSRAAYQANQKIPFFRVGSRMFYTGADLINEVDPKYLNRIPNYMCTNIEDIFEGIEEPEYLLFGSELGALKGIDPSKAAALLNKAKGKKHKDGKDLYSEVPGLGRLYDFKNKPPLLFFPSSHCFFATGLGDLFDDHNLYFLIKRKEKKALPYFGVSFFKLGESTPSPKELADLAAKAIGPKARVFVQKNGHFLIYSKEVQEFDREGDPKNLCRDPESADFLALIKPFAEQRQKTEMILLANIKNLCSFGTKLANRIVLK